MPDVLLQVPMDRRRFLAQLGVASAAVSFGWSRSLRACGSSAEYFEEEFLDAGTVNTKTTRELAHFFSQGPLRDPSERFCAGLRGQGLIFSHLDGIKVLTSDNQFTTVAAPEGGWMMFDSQRGRFVTRVYSTGNNEQIIVSDPRMGENERWGDAFGLEHVVHTSIGLVLSHRVFGDPPGRLSLLAGKDEIHELIELGWAPTPVCALGANLVYFLNNAAYSLNLAKLGTPKLLGRLPSNPAAAVLTRQGVTATTVDGVWRLPWQGAPYRVFSVDDVIALFPYRDTVVVASPRRVWIGEGLPLHKIEAPDENLHYVAPIEGTDDLILCRGPSVLRYSRKTGALEHIGGGRPKMKLHAAAIFNDKLLTWSSQTWVSTGHGCSVSPPPRTYVVE